MNPVTIYQREDGDGEQLTVRSNRYLGDPRLYFEADCTDDDRDPGMITVRFHRHHVAALRDALTTWLQQNETETDIPQPALHADKHVTADDVLRIARNEIHKALEDAQESRMRPVARYEIRAALRRAVEQ